MGPGPILTLQNCVFTPKTCVCVFLAVGKMIMKLLTNGNDDTKKNTCIFRTFLTH